MYVKKVKMLMVNEKNEPVIDELTGIYNFRSFITEAEKMLEADKTGAYDILVWDIVQFKVVNDLYGVEAGDRLLKEIAEGFVVKLKGKGVYGRLGSDKFVCCIPAGVYNTDDLTNIYEFYVSEKVGIHKILMQGGCFHITERGIPVIKMCDRAILALNRIKGKYTEVMSEYSLDKRADVLMGQKLAEDLERGIKNREFKAYVQPIYSAADSKVSSGEVLVRWDHPELGFLPPGRFIGFFEKNYLITKLDKYVWEEACRMIRRMMDEGREIIPLSINVSRTDFLFDDLCDVLVGLVDKYQIDPKYLKIEITESAYIDNPDKIVSMMTRLKEYEFIVVMDDFGTGYSSFNTLRTLPFDILKIDKGLIDEIDTSNKAGNVVNSVIKMAGWLGMDVVAEGVEQINQLNFLRHMGCKYIQGYYFSKPLPEEEFFKLSYNEESVSEKKDSDNINLDGVFAVEDPEGRAFLDKLVGALSIYELHGDELEVKRVNDEYCKLYGLTPYEIYQGGLYVLDENRGHKEKKILKNCKKSMMRSEPVNMHMSAVKSSKEVMYLMIKIYYLGKKDGIPQFLLNTVDITKEHVKRNLKQMSEISPILKNLYTEILKMDYTDGTISTVWCNETVVKKKHDNASLDAMLDILINKLIAPEDREEARKVFSYDEAMKFCHSDNRVKMVQFRFGREGDRKPCEFTLIRNDDDLSHIVITSCSRVLE